MTPRYIYYSRNKTIRYSSPEQPNLLPQIKLSKVKSLAVTAPKASPPTDELEEEASLLKQAHEKCNDWGKLRGGVMQILKDPEERDETIQFMRNTLDLLEFQRKRARSASPQERTGFNITRSNSPFSRQVYVLKSTRGWICEC